MILAHLGVSFKYNHEQGTLFMSQQPFIEELPHDLVNARSQDLPLKLKSPHTTLMPPNVLPKINESNITKVYQSIISLLLYLASWMCLDIAYAVVSLAQWNSALMRGTQRGC